MANASGSTHSFASQQTGQFLKLVERKITAEQYVKDLERRTSEQRVEGGSPKSRES